MLFFVNYWSVRNKGDREIAFTFWGDIASFFFSVQFISSSLLLTWQFPNQCIIGSNEAKIINGTLGVKCAGPKNRIKMGMSVTEVQISHICRHGDINTFHLDKLLSLSLEYVNKNKKNFPFLHPLNPLGVYSGNTLWNCYNLDHTCGALFILIRKQVCSHAHVLTKKLSFNTSSFMCQCWKAKGCRPFWLDDNLFS